MSRTLYFITAVFGAYEKTLKPVVRQIVPPDWNIKFVCFADTSSTVKNNGPWEIDREECHLRLGNRDACLRNSFINNTHSFNAAKFYKQQFHRISRLSDATIVVWIDATVEISSQLAAKTVIDTLSPGDSVAATWKHGIRSNVGDEVGASHFDRYTSRQWFGQEQPYQNVDKQWEDYQIEGFPDSNGLYCTCFIGVDLTHPKSRLFLDEWYMQTLMHTTQDQISLPYVEWKTNVRIHAYPDQHAHGHAHTRTSLFVKHSHHT